MRHFDYVRETEPSAAALAASADGARFIAGGTNLLDLSLIHI